MLAGGFSSIWRKLENPPRLQSLCVARWTGCWRYSASTHVSGNSLLIKLLSGMQTSMSPKMFHFSFKVLTLILVWRWKVSCVKYIWHVKISTPDSLFFLGNLNIPLSVFWPSFVVKVQGSSLCVIDLFCMWGLSTDHVNPEDFLTHWPQLLCCFSDPCLEACGTNTHATLHANSFGNCATPQWC